MKNIFNVPWLAAHRISSEGASPASSLTTFDLKGNTYSVVLLICEFMDVSSRPTAFPLLKPIIAAVGALFKRRAMPDSKTRLDLDWLDMGTPALSRAPVQVRQAIANMISRDVALLERFNR